MSFACIAPGVSSSSGISDRIFSPQMAGPCFAVAALAIKSVSVIVLYHIASAWLTLKTFFSAVYSKWTVVCVCVYE